MQESIVTMQSDRWLRTLQMWAHYEQACRDGVFVGTFDDFVSVILAAAGRLEA